MSTKMRCRIEELPFLADFTRDYYVRDNADFTAFSPVYGETFLQKYDAQSKLVHDVVSPEVLLAEQKAFTERIGKHYTTARNIVNRVERYAQLAAEAGLLKVNINDFGFRGIRGEIDNSNPEGLAKKLGDLLQLADSNKDALEPKGFTPAVREELAAFTATFEQDVKDQKRKMDQHKDLINANGGEFQVLWDMIHGILYTGTTIYKEKDKSKVDDYTYEKLIKKVRLKRKKDSGGDNGGTNG